MGGTRTGWILTWNIIFHVLSPIRATPLPENFIHQNWSDQRSPNYNQGLIQVMQHSPGPGFVYPNSFNVHEFQNLVKPSQIIYNPKGENNPNFLPKRKQSCSGRNNLLEDLGFLAVMSGAVGTVISIYSASYLSVLGNTISIVSGILSYFLGIPSAIITYLAVSDRISYAVANVLSVLSLANTAYSFWSVDYGNKDILTSQIANLIGVFSLGLSIVTTYPELFDVLIHELGSKYPENRREIRNFVNSYGCGSSPTYYKFSQEIIRQLAKL